MDKVAIELGVFFFQNHATQTCVACAFEFEMTRMRSNCLALNSVTIVNHTGSLTSQLQVEIVYG